MSNRSFWISLGLMLLAAGRGSAWASCNSVTMLPFYVANAQNNFASIDGGDAGVGVLAANSRRIKLNSNAANFCPEKVFLDDVPASDNEAAYRVVSFSANHPGTGLEVGKWIIDEFSPILSSSGYRSNRTHIDEDGDIYLSWGGPDHTWVSVDIADDNLTGSRQLFSVKIGHESK